MLLNLPVNTNNYNIFYEKTVLILTKDCGNFYNLPLSKPILCIFYNLENSNMKLKAIYSSKANHNLRNINYNNSRHSHFLFKIDKPGTYYYEIYNDKLLMPYNGYFIFENSQIITKNLVYLEDCYKFTNLKWNLSLKIFKKFYLDILIFTSISQVFSDTHNNHITSTIFEKDLIFYKEANENSHLGFNWLQLANRIEKLHAKGFYSYLEFDVGILPKNSPILFKSLNSLVNSSNYKILKPAIYLDLALFYSTIYYIDNNLNMEMIGLKEFIYHLKNYIIPKFKLDKFWSIDIDLICKDLLIWLETSPNNKCRCKKSKNHLDDIIAAIKSKIPNLININNFFPGDSLNNILKGQLINLSLHHKIDSYYLIRNIYEPFLIWFNDKLHQKFKDFINIISEKLFLEFKEWEISNKESPDFKKPIFPIYFEVFDIIRQKYVSYSEIISSKSSLIKILPEYVFLAKGGIEKDQKLDFFEENIIEKEGKFVINYLYRNLIIIPNSLKINHLSNISDNYKCQDFNIINIISCASRIFNGFLFKNSNLISIQSLNRYIDIAKKINPMINILFKSASHAYSFDDKSQIDNMAKIGFDSLILDHHNQIFKNENLALKINLDSETKELLNILKKSMIDSTINIKSSINLNHINYNYFINYLPNFKDPLNLLYIAINTFFQKNLLINHKTLINSFNLSKAISFLFMLQEKMKKIHMPILNFEENSGSIIIKRKNYNLDLTYILIGIHKKSKSYYKLEKSYRYSIIFCGIPTLDNNRSWLTPRAIKKIFKNFSKTLSYDSHENPKYLEDYLNLKNNNLENNFLPYISLKNIPYENFDDNIENTLHDIVRIKDSNNSKKLILDANFFKKGSFIIIKGEKIINNLAIIDYFSSNQFKKLLSTTSSLEFASFIFGDLIIPSKIFLINSINNESSNLSEAFYIQILWYLIDQIYPFEGFSFPFVLPNINLIILKSFLKLKKKLPDKIYQFFLSYTTKKSFLIDRFDLIKIYLNSNRLVINRITEIFNFYKNDKYPKIINYKLNNFTIFNFFTLQEYSQLLKFYLYSYITNYINSPFHKISNFKIIVTNFAISLIGILNNNGNLFLASKLTKELKLFNDLKFDKFFKPNFLCPRSPINCLLATSSWLYFKKEKFCFSGAKLFDSILIILIFSNFINSSSEISILESLLRISQLSDYPISCAIEPIYWFLLSIIELSKLIKNILPSESSNFINNFFYKLSTGNSSSLEDTIVKIIITSRNFFSEKFLDFKISKIFGPLNNLFYNDFLFINHFETNQYPINYHLTINYLIHYTLTKLSYEIDDKLLNFANFKDLNQLIKNWILQLEKKLSNVKNLQLDKSFSSSHKFPCIPGLCKKYCDLSKLLLFKYSLSSFKKISCTNLNNSILNSIIYSKKISYNVLI